MTSETVYVQAFHNLDARIFGYEALSTGDVIAISESEQARPTYYSVDTAGFTKLASEPRIGSTSAAQSVSPR